MRLLISKIIIILAFLLLLPAIASAALTINYINLTPELDISFFGDYNVTANITNDTSVDLVKVNISTQSGDGGSCWEYYVNGTCAEDEPVEYEMSYVSENIYLKNYVRPDLIYPQIEFGPDSIFWYNFPQRMNLDKNSYHILHFTNNFTPVENMSLWLEFDIDAKDSSRSKDVLVYLVSRGQAISYFQDDWRLKENTTLVSSIPRTLPKNHEHTENSSHHLVKLLTNEDGTVTSHSLNISDEFWIALHTPAVSSQGWNVSYRNDSLCNNSGNWYIGNQQGWTTSLQSGCPDIHVHLARRNTNSDSVNITLWANDSLANEDLTSSSFSFGELPKFPPLPTSFLNPINQTYSRMLNITWSESSDPNGDAINYNLSLLNADGIYNSTLNTSTNLTSYYWNTSSVDDGIYDLRIEVCDTSNECSNFSMSLLYSNFTIDNTAPTLSFSCSSDEVYIRDEIECSCSATDNYDSDPEIVYSRFPGTNTVGTFTIFGCNATDENGNVESINFTYEVKYSPGSGTSGGSSSATIQSNESEELNETEEEIIEQEDLGNSSFQNSIKDKIDLITETSINKISFLILFSLLLLSGIYIFLKIIKKPKIKIRKKIKK